MHLHSAPLGVRLYQVAAHAPFVVSFSSFVFGVVHCTVLATSRCNTAPLKDMSKVRCHKCGGVGHYRSDCPTHDSDAANIAVADDDHDEEQALTAIADDIEETWYFGNYW